MKNEKWKKLNYKWKLILKNKCLIIGFGIIPLTGGLIIWNIINLSTKTTPGPQGPASTIPGPQGPMSTIPGPAGPKAEGGFVDNAKKRLIELLNFMWKNSKYDSLTEQKESKWEDLIYQLKQMLDYPWED